MILAWFRARRYARIRAAALRATAEHHARQSQHLQAQSDAAYAAALRHPHVSPERLRLECLSHRLACESMAAMSRAGGDDTTAQMHEDCAEWWSDQARKYVTEDAHA